MKFMPHDYQEEGIKFVLQNAAAGLLFSPGLGKTAIMLAAILLLKKMNLIRRVLLVAPRRVLHSVWAQEIAKWDDFNGSLSFVALHGPNKDNLLRQTSADICGITPEGLAWLSKDKGVRWDELHADMLVVDESSYFRHVGSLRFRNLKPILPRFKRRVILTGTPMPRSYEDLFPQMFILDLGGALGRYITHFRYKWFVDVGYGYPDWRLRPGAEVEINERIRPLVLRGDMMDHIKMPSLVRNAIMVDLPPAARRQYDRLERDYYLAVDDTRQKREIDAATAAILSTKLRQCANGFVYTTDGSPAVYLHDEKLDALASLLSELNGKPALVLYEFLEDAKRIKHMLGYDVPTIGGTTNDALAEQHISAFNSGSIPVLLAHPASAGHGINLQATAQHVVFFGATFNLEYFDQAIARVWRQGNPHGEVFVHTIAARRTKEDEVVAVLHRKERTQADMLAALKPPVTVAAA